MPDDGALLVDELTDPVIGEIEKGVEGIAPERQRFRRPLHLDEAAVAGLHDVHVDFGAAVVVVRQIEQRLAVDDADTDGGDIIRQRDRADEIALAKRY